MIECLLVLAFVLLLPLVALLFLEVFARMAMEWAQERFVAMTRRARDRRGRR